MKERNREEMAIAPSQNIEERLSQMESRIAALELARTAQETRDIALLARIDGFIDDLRRVERVQMRAFDTLMATQQEQAEDIKALKETQSLLVEAARDHKRAIEALHTGQRQIIELLTGGKPQTLD